MNCYSLFVPFVLNPAVITADVADRTARTMGYLLKMQKASRTVYGEMTQAIGAAGANAPARGLFMEFDTDTRLPDGLDVPQGFVAATNLFAIPATDQPVPALFLNSVDQQKTAQEDNIDQPYPMGGDMVVYVHTSSIDKSTSGQIRQIAPSAALNYGIWVGVVNADALDGVLPNAFAAARGTAIFGPPRQSITLPGMNLAASPRNVGQSFKR